MTFASLFALFGAGLLTFASPCVLPMLPVYLSVLGGAQATGDEASAKTRLRLAGIGFALGLSLVFVALGVGASALSETLSAHRKAMLVGSGVLMALFGAHLLGLLKLGFLQRESRPLLLRVPASGGLLGGALFGAAFGLGWTPCVGPVLGAALTYSASTGADAPTAAVQLGAYALGLSLPLVLAAFFAEKVLGMARKVRAATPVLQKATGGLLVAVGLLLATDRLDAVAPDLSMGEGAALANAEAPCETGEAEGACEAPSGGVADGEVELPRGAPRLVQFVSGKCPACAKMAPLVDRLEKACTHEPDTIVRINVDEPRGRALARHYGVRLVPTFLSVDAEGNEVTRMVGEQKHETLALAIGDVRGQACVM